MQVNIIQKGRGWNLAPSTGESWGGNLVLHFRPVGLVFEMHDITGEYLPGVPWLEPKRFVHTYRKAKALNIPIIGLDEYEFEGLKFQKYPMREIVEEFDETLFSCTTDYMLAYAIYKKYDKIDVYGVNVEMGEEYYFERPSVEFWRGMAKGRRIDINFHGPTTVGKSKKSIVYGYLKTQDEIKEWLSNEK